MSKLFKQYYVLTKPGIIYGNSIAVIGGFFLAERGHFNLQLFLATLLGSALIMASACVFNNYIDRDIDVLMKRTKIRALVTGEVTTLSALVYASILGILGVTSLIVFTNYLTTLIGIIGFITYVIIYGWWKRRSAFGTIIGSIAGAVPPLAGYTAVTNHLDIGAVLVFLIMVLWQMPHFYSIAIFRRDDYTHASIPVLPVSRGVETTKRHILAYLIAYLLVSPLLTLFGYTGYTYAAAVLLMSMLWLWRYYSGLHTTDAKLWARKLFTTSLIVMLISSVMLCLGPVLP